MKRRFSDQPIRIKLTIIVFIVSLLAVSVLAGFFLIDKITSFRRNMADNLTTLGEMIGINSSASLIFDVPQSADELLSALKAKKEILYAGILRSDGTIFATYRKPSAPLIPPEEADLLRPLRLRLASASEDEPDEQHASVVFRADHIDVTRPVRLDNETIGYVVLRADLGPMNEKILWSILLVVGLMILLVIAAYLISRRLHRTVIDPITDLTSAMEMVSEQQNYGTRLKKINDDEIGMLINGFNEMLSQIQKRDEELAIHRDRLEDAVNTRTAELLHSNIKLKAEMEERIRIQDQLAQAQKMEAIGTLAAGVAHDLNNILSGIVSYPDLLLMNLPEDSPMRKPLQTIQSSGVKAAAIVQDLLTLARRGVSVDTVVDLRRLITDYLAGPEHQKMLGYHPGVQVETRLDADAVKIKGSPVHLEKTLMNLVYNAAEAMTDNGKITISLSSCYIDGPMRGYSSIKAGDYVLLTVADTGIGIAADDLSRIFEPFYTKKKMGRSGTGLGMTVVWGTIKDHNGYIDVKSRHGQGTTFYLYFPAVCSDDAEETVLPPPSSESLQGNGERILVVDDLEQQREIAVKMLETLSYRPRAVSGGEAAVEYLKSSSVDLVLLDMIMEPGIDGLETYRRIIEIHPRQRAIIASGFSETDRVKKARRLGIGGYIQKPYTLEKVAMAVKEELARES